MACAAQASSPNGRQARPIVSAAVSMGFGTYEQMPFLMISGKRILAGVGAAYQELGRGYCPNHHGASRTSRRRDGRHSTPAYNRLSATLS